jgi:hypothetical protein
MADSSMKRNAMQLEDLLLNRYDIIAKYLEQAMASPAK